jgi:hypothetical protein
MYIYTGLCEFGFRAIKVSFKIKSSKSSVRGATQRFGEFAHKKNAYQNS